MRAKPDYEMPFRFTSPLPEQEPVASVDTAVAVRPEFASEADARNRYSKVQEGKLLNVQLIPGHGNSWPLWDDSTGYPLDPIQLNLSHAVVTRLRRWTDEWFALANAALEAEPPNELVLGQVWFDEGDELTRDLAKEIWSFGQIIPLFHGYQKAE